jgi:hypothetical protein
VSFALETPLSGAIDGDGDQCVDACEIDSDGDGTVDFSDCAPYDASVGPGAAEVCNAHDDDCNGLIDDPFEAMDPSCEDNDVCTGVRVCAPWPAGVGVRITEVMIDPAAVADADGEWIELFNGGDDPVNVAGWTLGDGAGATHVIVPGGALFIPPAGRVVLARNKVPAANGGVGAAYQYAGLALDNAAGSVVLSDDQGAEVDRVDYGPGYPLVPGASLALVSVEVDSASPTAWAASTTAMSSGDLGTPTGPNTDVQTSWCLIPDPLVCDDGVGCTNDACDPTTGCYAVPDDGNCDDGDACTSGHCDAATDCEQHPLLTAECLAPGAFCGVVGVIGGTATCDVLVARDAASTPAPASVQFSIEYDAASLTVTSLPAFTGSGHVVARSPALLTSWSGLGQIILANFGDPLAPLTEATFEAGVLDGEPFVLSVGVEIAQDIPPTQPAYLTYSTVYGATADAVPLFAQVLDALLVFGLAP